jgi:hypothetical protein
VPPFWTAEVPAGTLTGVAVLFASHPASANVAAVAMAKNRRDKRNGADLTVTFMRWNLSKRF